MYMILKLLYDTLCKRHLDVIFFIDCTRRFYNSGAASDLNDVEMITLLVISLSARRDQSVTTLSFAGEISFGINSSLGNYSTYLPKHVSRCKLDTPFSRAKP